MKHVEDFEPLLGPRLRNTGVAELQSVAQRWGVVFPVDLVEVLAAYGDSYIGGHISLFGPATLEKMSTYREGHRYPPTLAGDVPRLVFPEPGGLLEWATTSTGDALCLQPSAQGEWTVSTYDQLVFEWTDYDLCFSEWLYAALEADPGFDIFPPLGETHPVSVEPLNVEKFLRW